MKTLDRCDLNTFMVIETSENAEERKYLNNIGVCPEMLVTVIKNNQDSSQPLLIEVSGARFMLAREISQKILVVSLLEDQDKIFKGNKTHQRSIILEVLGTYSGHFSLQECVQSVQKKEKNIGEITVYRTIKTLREKNIIEEVVLPSGEKKYELCKGHHNHIFCKNCGNIMEFYSDELEKIEHEIAKKHKVKLLSHTMTLIASECEECR